MCVFCLFLCSLASSTPDCLPPCVCIVMGCCCSITWLRATNTMHIAIWNLIIESFNELLDYDDDDTHIVVGAVGYGDTVFFVWVDLY